MSIYTTLLPVSDIVGIQKCWMETHWKENGFHNFLPLKLEQKPWDHAKTTTTVMK